MQALPGRHPAVQKMLCVVVGKGGQSSRGQVLCPGAVLRLDAYSIRTSTSASARARARARARASTSASISISISTSATSSTYRALRRGCPGGCGRGCEGGGRRPR